MALFPGLPGSAGTRKVEPIWILLKQETVSGSGISWAICKSVPRSRQITTPAPHHLVFYRPDALPAAQPTASKHCMLTDKNESWMGLRWGRLSIPFLLFLHPVPVYPYCSALLFQPFFFILLFPLPPSANLGEAL